MSELTTIDKAIIMFHKADEVEKTAKAMREQGRACILKALDQGTITAGIIEAQGRKVSVTVPMSKAKPASFNQDKAQELYEYAEDACSELLPAIEAKTSYTVNMEVLIALMKTVESGKASLIARIEGYLIPAIESAPLAPRLQAK